MSVSSSMMWTWGPALNPNDPMLAVIMTGVFSEKVGKSAVYL